LLILARVLYSFQRVTKNTGNKMKTLLLLFLTFFITFNAHADVVDHYEAAVQSINSQTPRSQGTISSTVISNAISQPILLSIGAFSLPSLIISGSVAATAGVILVKQKVIRNSYSKMIALYYESLDRDGSRFNKLHKYVEKKTKRRIEKVDLAFHILNYFDEENEKLGNVLVKFDHAKQKEKLLTYRKFKKQILKTL
jgi:hypothetical protein